MKLFGGVLGVLWRSSGIFVDCCECFGGMLRGCPGIVLQTVRKYSVNVLGLNCALSAYVLGIRVDGGQWDRRAFHASPKRQEIMRYICLK